jgi:hypothetical protein
LNHHLHLDLAPPKSWDQFEELCADTFAAEWRDPALIRYGRAGQSQCGVDIVATDGARWPVGVQCKKKSRWPVSKVSITELEAEVEKAKGFTPKLEAFYLVSSAPNDNALDKRARELTKAHKKQGLFSVTVIGWGELVRRATLHRNVAAKHFGAFGADVPAPLLANWKGEKAKLVMSDRELAIAIRELIHDFRDFPGGRLVFRQRESELLLRDIAEQRKKGTSLKNRDAILTLRDRLERLESRERRVMTGLQLLLAHEDLADYLRVVWPNDAPLVIRSYIEHEIDPDSMIVTGMHKIRIRAPNTQEPEVAVYLTSEQAGAIMTIQQERRAKYGATLTDSVGELPDDVRSAAAIPYLIARLVTLMKEGASIDELGRQGLLHISMWRAET